MLDQHVIHVAVAPVLSRFEGSDNRVSRAMEVLGGVLVLRLVAATYMPANQAFTQVDPPVTGPEALLAALGGGDHVLPYLTNVRASLAPKHLN